MALETQTGSIESGPNFGQKNWVECTADQGICSLHKNYSSNLGFFSSLSRVKSTTGRDCEETKCHWYY